MINMPEPANSYAKLPSQQQTFYDKVLLDRLLPELHFLEHGQKYKRPIPKNAGTTINFRRFNSLPIPADSLVEGITPAGTNLSVSQITTTVKQEGSYTLLTDLLDLVGLDDVITETTELNAEQAALTLETRVRDVVFNGTNVYYVGGGIARVNVGAANVFTGTDVRRVRQIMARNNVKTEGGSYVGFIHPDGAYDLKGHAEWREPNLYAGAKKIFNGEIGELYGVRWIESNMCPIWVGEGNAGADVYGALVVGSGAYGVVDVAGSSKPEVIVKQKGSAGSADPLDQRSTVGWKALIATVRLQELAMIRVEHCSSL
jgi:N4-gp56 family major capsid protein